MAATAEESMKVGGLYLLRMLAKLMERGIEHARVVKCLRAVLEMGFAQDHPLLRRAAKYVNEAAREDGGWIGMMDTIDAAAVFTMMGEAQTAGRAARWLLTQQNADGGWGMFVRDPSRPVSTARVLSMLLDMGMADSLVVESAWAFLRTAWKRDFAMGGLTYKGAAYLAIEQKLPAALRDPDTATATIAWLDGQQHAGGGFSPSKVYPMGPGISQTIFVLEGLLGRKEEQAVRMCASAIGYLLKKQLPGGPWPEHDMDYVTAMALMCIQRYANGGGRH